IIKPGSYLFAVFQAQEKAESVPQYSFRIQDSKTLLVADRGLRKPAQAFNNRSLEKLFSEFDSLKFFLSRDKLREVIVRRLILLFAMTEAEKADYERRAPEYDVLWHGARL